MENKGILSYFKQALLLSFIMMILCGGIYPMSLTAVAKLVFPTQAQGSLIAYEGQNIGVQYVGQDFTRDYYFWGRPSAVHYNTYREKDGKAYTSDGAVFEGLASGSDNYSASNPELLKRVQGDINKFMAANPSIAEAEIPTDLMTASGSGLDPEISVKAAQIQVPRIAKASGLSEMKIKQIIKDNTQDKLFGIFGGEGVNVLQANLAITEAMKGE